MRLVRICIGASTLALGIVVLSASGAEAASACPPGRPADRPGGTGQPPGRPPVYPPGLCRLLLSRSSVPPGGSFVATGGGFGGGSTVTLTVGTAGTVAGGGGGLAGRSLSSALRLATVETATTTASGSGRITAELTIPVGTALGQYLVSATGVDAAGEPYELTAPIGVVAAAANPRTAAAARPAGILSRTGINPLAPAGAGLALAAGGLGLTLAARRRRATAA